MKLALILLALPAFAVDPSIVWIGDVHLNQSGQPTTWTTQTNWIASNVSTWNIQAVLCAGDFDGFSGDPAPNLAAGWTDGWSTIDGLSLPYLSAVGNHDYANNDPSSRDTTAFDAQIGYSRINGKTWWGGFYNDGASSKANQYIFATIGTHNLLILALELYPRPAAIAWANGIIAANLSKEIIVITHAYTGAGGALMGETDPYGPSTYGLPGTSYSGVNLAAWAETWPNNVHLILAGHYDPPAFAQRLDGRVYGITSDYQDSTPLPSQSIVIIAFGASSIVVNNLNTTTGTLDTTTYPPFTLAWPIAPLSPTYTLIH